MAYKFFEYPISINVSDIDENDHVNNISYLKWVQDVAIAHWNSISDTEMRSKYLWVVEPDGAKSFRY